MDAVTLINFILSTLIAILFAYKFVIGIIGLFKRKSSQKRRKTTFMPCLLLGETKRKLLVN